LVGPKSEIANIELASSGEKKIHWVSAHMPVLNHLIAGYEQAKPLKGFTLGLCLHLEAKTAYLAHALKCAGANVVACASNPLSTQDDVVAAMVQEGITVFAVYGSSPQDYERYLSMVLDWEPQIIIDDGGDLVSLAHATRPELVKKIIGGCEETTTGVTRLRSMAREGALQFPMISVNDANCKYLFDNRYGTGQSTWDGINRATNLVVAGKCVVIIGYGWCGRGTAMRAKGLGARVIVCEVDPIKANEALMDGHEVMPLARAAEKGDYFITVTGNFGVVRGEHFERMKNGAILANAGHFDVEISKPDLEALSLSRNLIKPGIEEFKLKNGNTLYLLAEGRLVNLAAGDGHPVEIMDMSFALQALCVEYLSRNTLPPGVHPVPFELDQQVARLRLEALGVEIDTLDPQQVKYLNSW
jgi:adenosylhomocysteinase